MSLRISFEDVLRATLPERSGNEGWLGVSPDGAGYHVVTPVDAQIAKGVMGCNIPTDGTPFGGYAAWIYFRCPQSRSCDEDSTTDERSREDRARHTADELIIRLRGYGIDARVESTLAGPDRPMPTDAARQGIHEEIACGCGRSWLTVGSVLTDPDVRFKGYLPNADDFRFGSFVFDHACGGCVSVSAGCFVGARLHARSLAGAHSCPGYCRHSTSTASCSADCEGAVYRRIARRLGAKSYVRREGYAPAEIRLP